MLFSKQPFPSLKFSLSKSKIIRVDCKSSEIPSVRRAIFLVYKMCCKSIILSFISNEKMVAIPSLYHASSFTDMQRLILRFVVLRYWPIFHALFR